MTSNKLVIRRLPPSMKEDDFLEHVSPLPVHDYFCFFEANSGLGPHSFSRAYINFKEHDDMCSFRERFDNYVFVDKDGHEYPAVVEQSLWHQSPTSGPFYVDTSRIDEEENEHEAKSVGEELKSKSNDGVVDTSEDVSSLWIEKDPDFFKFLENLQSQKKRPQHSPIQTLENNLEELNLSISSSRENQKVITPLIGYVNQQRSLKNSKRVR